MVVRLMSLKISSSGLSDVGLVRQNNEDVWAEIPGLHFYALADGMGGHQAGEIAAREAIDSLCHLVKKSLRGKSKSLEECGALIKTAFEQVNTYVYKMGRSSSDFKGMGTTLCSIYLSETGVVFAHVGDSRIYRYRKGSLEQITKDHSLICELVELGQINELQATQFIYKNIITRAIGTEPYVEPTIHFADIVEEDIYLLCSDGLSDLLSLQEIEAIIKKETFLSCAAKKLVDASKAKGGHDNITVVMVKVSEENEKQREDLS
ncbi:putative protein phosphatase 2C-type [Chlamydiales bacterium STE3]|nr:putative protein phosphatase 2C-type [Chlamydiales bacterium STE3]